VSRRFQALGFPQRLPRCALHRPPGRLLPRRASRRRERVHHASREERGPPTPVGVPLEPQVVALPVHATLEDADAAPAIEPVVKGLDDWRGRALEPKEGQRGAHQAGSAVELCDAHVVGTRLSVGFLRRFDHVTSNEIAYRQRHLLWMLEQEHMTAALDLAYFAAGQAVRKRRKPFC